MVRDHYERLGFKASDKSGAEELAWKLDLRAGYTPRNKHIQIKELVRG